MISVNIGELETLSTHAMVSSQKSEDILFRLKNLRNEMQTDLEFMEYPQALIVMESLGIASDAMFRADEILRNLRNVLLNVPEQYRENEKKFKDALSRMTEYMNTVSTDYGSVLLSEDMSYVEHPEEGVSQTKVCELVSENLQDMQVINISAVAKVVKEEYPVSEVRPLNAEE